MKLIYYDFGKQLSTQEQKSEYWLALTQRFPDSVEHWNNLGNAYHLEGSHSEAINAYQKGLKLDSTKHEVLYNLSVVYADMKNYTECEKYLLLALKEDPVNAVYLHLLGEILFRMGNKEKAIITLEKAAKLGSPKALSDLSNLLIDSGEYEKGNEYYKKYLEKVGYFDDPRYQEDD